MYIGKYGPVIARTGENGTKYTPLKNDDNGEVTLEGNSHDTIPKDYGLYKSEEIQVNKLATTCATVKITQLKITKTFRKEDAKKIIDGTFQKKSNVIKEFERGEK